MSFFMVDELPGYAVLDSSRNLIVAPTTIKHIKNTSERRAINYLATSTYKSSGDESRDSLASKGRVLFRKPMMSLSQRSGRMGFVKFKYSSKLV
jgi:hypothetical protein